MLGPKPKPFLHPSPGGGITRTPLSNSTGSPTPASFIARIRKKNFCLSVRSPIVEQVPEMAVELVNVNDAPMTIIYPGAVVKEPGSPSRLPGLAPSVVAQDGSVGIRIPASSAFCMALLHTFGGPIVSTSANISGEETPKTFSGISEEVKAGVDMVVDPSLEGSSSGRSSQIIQLGLDGQVKILRG